MEISYFNGKSWNQITREERLFCAELYFKLKTDVEPFLNICRKITKEEMKGPYDVGYEVCFYRDILHFYNIDNPKEKLSKKEPEKYKKLFSDQRTFDLALFSENEIHIFEAKCQQGFSNSQVDTFLEDKTDILGLLNYIKDNINPRINIPEKISLWAIISKEYNNKNHKETKKVFDKFENKIITWNKIYTAYSKNEILKRADNIYRK